MASTGIASARIRDANVIVFRSNAAHAHPDGSRHRSAQFSFKAVGEATGFQCALVRVPHGKHKKLPAPHYTSCFRAKKYTHLSVGHYIFYVRAIGPGGADRTPATHKFAIV